MSLQGKKVLVVGTGKSGIAATELLCANGIDTVLFDGNKELDSKTLYEKALCQCIYRRSYILFLTGHNRAIKYNIINSHTRSKHCAV